MLPGRGVLPGGARVGVPHGVVQVAGRSAGLQVQHGECVPERAGSEVAGQVGGQPGPGGEAAHGAPHVGGEQPSAGSGGEQHGDVLRAGASGEVGVDPGGGRTGQRQAPAAAFAAGDPQHTVPLAGAEVADVGADAFAESGAGEQQQGRQRGGAGLLGAWRLIGRVEELEGLGLG